MGRQAKRKRQRKQTANSNAVSPESLPPTPENPENSSDSPNFVTEFIHRGYSMERIARSPELPNTDPEPEV